MIKLYSLAERASHPVTSAMYTSSDPCFDQSGDYLYFFTNRSFWPTYEDYGDWANTSSPTPACWR